MFWVYSSNPQATLTGPVGQKNLEDGLDAKLVLFEDFKKDVTTAAANQAKKETPAQKSTL